MTFLNVVLMTAFLARAHLVMGVRPEEYGRLVAEEVKTETKGKHCCYDTSAGRNGCFNDVCFKPKKEGWKCPTECCSGRDCPSFLEEASTAETVAEEAKMETKGKYCCFDTSVGRNSCFNDVCFKPKKEGWKCPTECCSGRDCPSFLEEASTAETVAEEAKMETKGKYCCFDTSAGRNSCFNDVCFKPKKEGWKCPTECCSGRDCPSFLEEASTAETVAEEAKTETKGKYCCFDTSVGRNSCFNDVCFKPKKEGWKCPTECCSGRDCPSFLEEASTAETVAEEAKMETKGKYCCFDTSAGRNSCFNDVCFKPKKEGWKCPTECCSGRDCP